MVIYLHGSGGSLIGTGNELRQMAEMGLAAVGMEYCKTNEAVFESQFSALLDRLGRCRWADTNRMAWVGYSLGAQWQLTYALRHRASQPNLLVLAAGGRVVDVDPSKPPAFKSAVSALLVRGEFDEGFSDSDFHRLSEFFRSNGVPVDSKVLAGQGHGLGLNGPLFFRVLGEYCLTALRGDTALAK